MSIEDIIKCKYICSVGLIKLINQENQILHFDENLNVTHDYSNIENIVEGSCITIKSDNIHEFIHVALPRINKKFILFTANSDGTTPSSFLDQSTFFRTIENPHIIRWYSTNCLEHIHEKLTQIPIGMNLHCSTIEHSQNRQMWHDKVLSPQEQEEILDNIRNLAKPFCERELKCYSNFHFNHYAEFGNPRERAIHVIPKDLVFYEPTYTKRTIAWENQAKYAFVLSPLGHGMDCHRTWEALALGCIVIVETSPLDVLYRDLPVLILNNWADLTQELLQKTVEDFKNRTFNYERITLKYWHNIITEK